MLSERVLPIIEKVKNYHGQFDHYCCPSPTVGVALSGGADSVALLLIAQALGWHTVALHCNFHLRGDESVRDQHFCQELCASLGIHLEMTHFDVELLRQLPENRGKSVEMLCRDLRYEWFQKMHGALGLDRLALGHHMEDNIETAMLNALRRCGLAGVKGMLPISQGFYIRPMLCLTKEEILQLVEDVGVGFVEDSTNSENQFFRNRLRNLIIPTIEQSFHSALPSLAKTIDNLRDDWMLFEAMLADKRKQYTEADGALNLEAMLRNEPHPRSLLFKMLDGKLDRSAIDSLFDNITNSSKLYKLSDGREFILDRQYLRPAEAIPPLPDYEIYPASLWKQFSTQGTREFFFTLNEVWNAKLTIRIIPIDQFDPCRNPAYAWFSQKLAEMPELWFTRSHVGDRIVPFGMEGSRLVSDITTEAKFTRYDKEMQLTLRSPEGILWLPGLKNSALFPVSPSDRYIFEFHIEKSK